MSKTDSIERMSLLIFTFWGMRFDDKIEFRGIFNQSERSSFQR